jgi:hypothetical protein
MTASIASSKAVGPPKNDAPELVEAIGLEEV